MVIEVNDNNFQELLASAKTPVMVDFWAVWCGPCRMLSPLVDEMAEKFEGRLTVAKCNVDEAVEIPSQYGIRNIPTLLFFKDGQLVDRSVGALPKPELEAKINNLF